jgi:hypothetical protein
MRAVYEKVNPVNFTQFTTSAGYRFEQNALRPGSRLVQPGDFLIAQGAGKHREPAEESGRANFFL